MAGGSPQRSRVNSGKITGTRRGRFREYVGLCGSQQAWQLSVASVQLLGAQRERLLLFVGGCRDRRGHSALGCSLKSSITSLQIELVFVVEMALFPMSVSNVLSGFGRNYPDRIA